MLNKEDYIKINQVMVNMHRSYFPENDKVSFRHIVLNSLSEQFNYNKSSFIIIDKEDTFEKPMLNNVSLNIGRELYSDYYDYYYKLDVAYPDNNTQENKDKIKDSLIYYLSDYLKPEEYEKTDFYKKFMKKHNLYYFLIMILKYKGKQVGHIGFYRAKDEKPFTERDVEILSILNESISVGLFNHIKINETLNEVHIFNEYMESFPLGVVVLDSNYNYIRSNSSAEEIFNRIGYKKMHHFKEYFMAKLMPKIQFKLNHLDQPQLTRIDNYIFQVSQFYMPSKNRLQRYYNIYIMELSKAPELKTSNLEKDYDLTIREKEIVELIARGCTNESIADEMAISIYTVKTHIRNIYKKLDAHNRTTLLYKIKNHSS
jgi:DNA-binding CsgD family transcriptional regulator